jgi:hypothetical protein
MAIIQGLCGAGNALFLRGLPSTDVLKIALYTSQATLSSSTTAYTTSYEVVGSGYAAGGNQLTGRTAGYSGKTGWLTFNDVYWPLATITARGALIYDSSQGNTAIAVLDFGADRSVTNATFKVTFPVGSATTAVIRFS